jgi:hydroxyethylthiazole kinase-like uncharacterized protein yjeF
VRIVTASQMRQIEMDCAGAGLSPAELMENAGRAFAEETKRLLGDAKTVKKQSIIILAGPGNNGGDGLVAARYLSEWGARLSLYLFGDRPETNENLAKARERGTDITKMTGDDCLSYLDERLTQASTVIDAVFGTGTTRPFQGTLKKALEMVANAKAARPALRIIALDLPSGLGADSGTVDPATLYADNTVTLGFPKIGLFRPPGAERAGKITTVDIGIPAEFSDQISNELITDSWVMTALPPRPPHANKGSFGRVLVISGSASYVGAAYLACAGAMRVGAGLVTLGTGKTVQPMVAAKLTEATYLLLPEADGALSAGATRPILESLGGYDALLIGCGLGQNRTASDFIVNTLLRPGSPPVPLVLDADALNILSRLPEWWCRLTDDAVITPHPGEMARLAGTSVEAVQAERLELTKRLALEWHKTIVLKGAYTVITAPDGRTMTSPWANPGLASAGTGDVLSGMITGLLAQGMSLFDAAAAAVYLHGLAGELVKDQMGDTGMLASDLLPAIPLATRRIKGSTGVAI